MKILQVLVLLLILILCLPITQAQTDLPTIEATPQVVTLTVDKTVADLTIGTFSVVFAGVVILVAFGRTALYLWTLFQKRKLDLKALGVGIENAVRTIENSDADEALEKLYMKYGQGAFGNVIDTILRVTDPEDDMTASDARKILHGFLKRTTDGDLST